MAVVPELVMFYAISLPLGVAVFLVLRVTHPALVIVTGLDSPDSDAEPAQELPRAA